MPRPTISDVAKLSGVSTATVSHILNDTRYVSDEVKEKVNSAIQQLGYTRNSYARNFRTGKTKTIGFIVPDIANRFFSSMIQAVEDVLSKENYHLIIANTRETPEIEAEHLSYLSSGIVDGLLIASAMQSCNEITRIVSSSLPVVLVDRALKGNAFDSITSSSYDVVYGSVENLIKNGHTKIGCIAGLEILSTAQERLHAYEHAMRHYFSDIPTEFIQPCNGMANSARFCVEQLLQAGCTAILISNGTMSLDVINYFVNNSLTVGKDVDLVCFSDSDSFLPTPFNQMDLITMPVNDMGRAAGGRILNRISHPDEPMQNIIFKCNYQRIINTI